MSGRSQILDELEHLAAVEHAFCVEYLFLDCALVESEAFNLASLAMTQFRVVNDVTGLHAITAFYSPPEAAQFNPQDTHDAYIFSDSTDGFEELRC